MKIAHILNELRFSGAEILLTSAAPRLLSAGPALVICTGDKEGDYADYMRAAGYLIVHVPFSRSPTFFLSIARVLKRHRVDLVHIHTERAAVWYSAICAALRLPNLRTIHNEFRFTGALKRARGRNRRIAARLGTRHVACSPSVQRVEASEFGLDTVVVNNWFDPARIVPKTSEDRAVARQRLGVASDAFVAVSISNEAPAKNLGGLFRGVARARELGCQVELFHCGEVGEQLLDYAAAHDGINAVGSTPDVLTYLFAADVFLCTSYNEGGQIVLLEAAASGTTCITTKVGLAELFADEEAVRFIEPSPESLAQALVESSLVPAERRRVAEAHLAATAATRFSPETGARHYLALYNELGRTGR